MPAFAVPASAFSVLRPFLRPFLSRWALAKAVCLAATLAGVCGCEQRQATTPAAPAPAQQEADPKVLMAIAFPGWLSDQNHVVTSPVKDELTEFLVVTPSLVVPLAENRVVLLVEGTPSDEQGNAMAGHASQGNLGAYWFARQSGKWVQTAAQPSVAMTGFSGEIGRLQRVELGGGRIALAVTNGSCWQGQCGEWLSLYELGEQHAQDMLGEEAAIMIHSDALGFSEGCETLAKLAPGTTHRLPLDAYSPAVGCYDVTGEWSIARAPDQERATPGDLVIYFKGVQTAVETVPKQAAKPKAPAKVGTAAREFAGPQGAGSNANPANNEYLATVSAVEAVLTYRYENGRYVKASGENPAPGI